MKLHRKRMLIEDTNISLSDADIREMIVAGVFSRVGVKISKEDVKISCDGEVVSAKIHIQQVTNADPSKLKKVKAVPKEMSTQELVDLHREVNSSC